MKNREIRLASRPEGLPTEDNFQFVDTDVSPVNDGEVLLKSLYISVDPYLRGRMREGKSYVRPFEIGEVFSSGVVAEVVESKSPDLKPGDLVTADLGWRLYNVIQARYLMKPVPGVSPSTALGVLGMPGLTAYFGLLEIGKPKEGETVFVSGAAGAVGITVCQIAKIKGCRVVGTAGSDEKTEYLERELGVDVALNYKTAGNMHEAIKAACPNGIDVYFDNVGGPVSDAVMGLINDRARIVICGQISIYNSSQPDIGLRPQAPLLVHSAVMEGFIITRFLPRAAEGLTQLAQWFTNGKLKHAETIAEGFENTPKAFIGLFSGENLGKQIVKI
ncbi:MAG TPA: NADP-dependent oxidoreductase [Pyrinomonadaceae bacterium]